MGGMFAVIGMQAALRERERTGRGQMVKSALFESTAFLMMQHMAGEVVTGKPMPPMPSRDGAWAIYEPFPTAEGEQIFVGITSDGQWRRFCEHFARRSAARSRLQDQRGPRARAAGAPPAGRRNRRRHKLAELAELFDRIDIPFAPVAKPGDLFDDPQLNAGGRMLDIAFPTASARNCRGCRSRWAIMISRCAGRRRASASTPAKFSPSSGLTPDEIAALIKRGVVTAGEAS